MPSSPSSSPRLGCLDPFSSLKNDASESITGHTDALSEVVDKGGECCHHQPPPSSICLVHPGEAMASYGNRSKPSTVRDVLEDKTTTQKEGSMRIEGGGRGKLGQDVKNVIVVNELLNQNEGIRTPSMNGNKENGGNVEDVNTTSMASLTSTVTSNIPTTTTTETNAHDTSLKDRVHCGRCDNNARDGGATDDPTEDRTKLTSSTNDTCRSGNYCDNENNKNCSSNNNGCDNNSNGIGSYLEGPSQLDVLDAASGISQSQYRGLATLMFIATAYYLIANPFLRYYERNEFVDPTLAEAMFYDFFFLMFMWAKISAWSVTAYFIHLMYLRGRIGRRTVYVLQHFTQSVAIAYAVAQCFYNNWPIVPAAFVQIIAVVSFMKMHSYTERNLEFNSKQGTLQACPLYPQNVNLRNFCYYLATPALVYEPEFPRGNGFRLTYFVCKLISMVGAMTVIYLTCTSYVIPTIIRSPSVSLMEAILSLIFPFLFLDFLTFFLMFECICNLLAEVTNFANRDFYRDWWNSKNWDEYSRKWNRPVHKFLLQHVYYETQQRYRWSPRYATFVTFLFSALLHEMIMAVCFRILRFYLFSLMLLQIPLIALGRLYQHNHILANAIFWACLLVGPPLLAVSYGREWAQIHFYSEGGDRQELRLF